MDGLRPDGSIPRPAARAALLLLLGLALIVLGAGACGGKADARPSPTPPAPTATVNPVVVYRTAVAEGVVVMRPETLSLIREGDAKKGDVIGTARLAGIMAAKRTH